MTNLDPSFCRKVKEARREAGLSQSVLAAEIGCKQSALSMFENLADGTKLNDDVIERLSKKFGIEIVTLGGKGEEDAEVVPSVMRTIAVLPRTGFCPNPNCPGHHRYQVEERIILRPDREVQDPVGGKFCALCGEVLERRCPNCGAPVHDGGICSFCGNPYVVAV